jgi:hypothetical protein
LDAFQSGGNEWTVESNVTIMHISYVTLLIKFVKEMDHAINFLDGELFCNPWIFFKDIEDKQRGDRLELAASKLHTRVLSRLLNISYDIWLEDAGDRFTPVFCMYAVSNSSSLPSIRLQLKETSLRDFGKFGVVITNTGEFINRLNNNLPEFSYGLINYIDYDNLIGENERAIKNPILSKDRKTFGHQREFRIYNTHYAITSLPDPDIPPKEIIYPNKYGGAYFSIGTLRDIAEVHTIDELFRGMDLCVQNPINKKNMSKELWWNGTNYQVV